MSTDNPNPNPNPETPPANTPPATPPETVITKEQYQKILDQMKSAETKAAQLEAQVQDSKIKGMKEKEDWQGVAAAKEKEADDAKAEAKKLREAVVSDKVSAALREEAIKHGINPASLQDLDLLDFDELRVETTSTGKINVFGAPAAVQKLKSIRPHWFSKPTPGVNPDSPQLNAPPPGGVISYEMVQAKYKEWEKNKTSNEAKKAYQEMAQAFNKQNS